MGDAPNTLESRAVCACVRNRGLAINWEYACNPSCLGFRCRWSYSRSWGLSGGRCSHGTAKSSKPCVPGTPAIRSRPPRCCNSRGSSKPNCRRSSIPSAIRLSATPALSAPSPWRLRRRRPQCIECWMSPHRSGRRCQRVALPTRYRPISSRHRPRLDCFSIRAALRGLWSRPHRPVELCRMRAAPKAGVVRSSALERVTLTANRKRLRDSRVVRSSGVQGQRS